MTYQSSDKQINIHKIIVFNGFSCTLIKKMKNKTKINKSLVLSPVCLDMVTINILIFDNLIFNLKIVSFLN